MSSRSRANQCSKCSVLNFVFFVILTTDSSQASVDQGSTAGDSDPSLFFYQDRMYPRDCKEVQAHCSTQNTTGARLIRPDGYFEPFWVSCSGEWTVIQRRSDRLIGFDRSWTDYRSGFGYPSVDHWLGNERLSYLTNQKVYELRIELETVTGERGYLSYDAFRINDEFGDYSLVSLVHRDSMPIPCPRNMVYGNCSRCIATCGDPSGTVNCSTDCTDFPLTCVCPANYLMDGPNCVPREQCGCYMDNEGVITEGARHVMSNCTECTCVSGVLTCDPRPCAQEATCTVVNGSRGCSCNEGYEGDGRTCTTRIRSTSGAKDCYDIWALGGYTASGNYTLSPPGWTGGEFTVNCNMTIDGGNWTVIQRRIQSSSRLDFYQNWATYEEGFGSPSGEFWIGNEKLHFLTSQGDYELRIDMVQYSSHLQYYAKYDSFRIGDGSSQEKYKLSSLGTFSGSAGYDAFRSPDYYPEYYNLENMYFSTHDQDNDRYSGNCASSYRDGWWYNSCAYAYMNINNYNYRVGYWYYLPSGSYNLIYTEMKIRPRVATR